MSGDLEIPGEDFCLCCEEPGPEHCDRDGECCDCIDPLCSDCANARAIAEAASLTVCRTLAEVYAAADADSAGDKAPTQEEADYIFALLAAHIQQDAA